MQRPSDREIQERFDDLPHEVQQAIQSADMTAALTAVGSAHGLHIDQLGALEDEALLVMLGFGNPAEFPSAIQTALRLDADTADQVASEVSERLFVPIRTAMREYMEERLKRSAQRTTSNAQQATGELSTPLGKTGFGRPPAVSSTPTAVPAAAGGKTILPSSASPVLHPIDAMLAKPTMTTPAITDFSAPGALQTPKTPATKQYANDPYREPVE